MTTTTTNVPTSRLNADDVVLTHGMRVRLTGARRSHPTAYTADNYSVVYVWTGIVENIDEVLAEGFVPSSFIPDGEWIIQGNDLATWTIETLANQTATTPAPAGVSGDQRSKFLTLTEEQRQTYRHHFDVCGRLAAHCYLIATGQMSV